MLDNFLVPLKSWKKTDFLSHSYICFPADLPHQYISPDQRGKASKPAGLPDFACAHPASTRDTCGSALARCLARSCTAESFRCAVSFAMKVEFKSGVEESFPVNNGRPSFLNHPCNHPRRVRRTNKTKTGM